MDYRGAFAPFAYSSGESVVATSDAQNIDYGVLGEPSEHYFAHGEQTGDGNKDPTFNGTGESLVSDFGNVRYPFGFKGKAKKEKAVATAMANSRSGVSRTAGFTRGAVAGGGRVGTATRPLDEAQKGFRGTLDGQNEMAVNRSYDGQLGE